MAGAASIAVAVAIPPVASAQASEANDNSDLEPIRALLDAHDAAFTNHDLEGVRAAAIMGCGPREIWSGSDESKRIKRRFDGSKECSS
jgi:hypothetical protein